MKLRFLFAFAFSVLLIAGSTTASADYVMILPLQYNAYQPVSARAVGLGDSWGAQPGLAALFANPTALPAAAGIHAELTASGMSAFQSHGIITTEGSSAIPGVIAAGWSVGNNTLAVGLRRAMRAELAFPDPVRPQVAERMAVDIDQARGGWCIRLAGRFRLGLALGYDRAMLDWRDTISQLAHTSITSENYALGCQAEIWRGLDAGLYYQSKTNFDGQTAFTYRDTLRTLRLLGGEPAVTGFTARYQLDSGLVLSGQAELTGWQSVTEGYLGTLDWHFGAELDALPGVLTLRAGAASLLTPLDNPLRQDRPDLHNLYFLTLGAGLRYWRIRADLGVASSYPLSGKGLNQNMVALTLGYSQ